MEGLGNEQDSGTWHEIPNESIKNMLKMSILLDIENTF